MAVTLTPAAAQHVAAFLAKRGKGMGLRLGVRTTGCSGLAYKLEYADETQPEDLTFETNGVKVVIDPKSLIYLRGSVLDYEVKLMQHGFKFRNPNEKAGCGCGESFTV